MTDKNSNIKVSVIVPVFNVQEYLEKALTSVACQTLDNYEVVIVNDGSTDNSMMIIDDYVKRHENFSLIMQKNSGLSAARNAGLEKAEGEFIVFLDSDDFLQPDYLEKMYNACKDNDADICYCAHYLYINNRKFRFFNPFTGRNTVLDKKTALNRLVRDNTMHYFAWNKMYRRSIFADNNIQFPDMYFEDVATTPRTFFYSNKVVVLSRALYNYTKRKGSILNTMNVRKVNDYMKAYGIVRNFLEKNQKFDEYKNSFVYYGIRMMICNYYSITRIHILARNFNGFAKNIQNSNRSVRYLFGKSFKTVDGEVELISPVEIPENKQTKCKTERNNDISL